MQTFKLLLFLSLPIMIQEIKIKNFLSFRDEIVLNFEATKDTTFEEYQVYEVAPGVRLLRFALVYGANASGKSNLLIALDFLRKFWYNQQDDLDSPTNVIPFLLDKETPDQPCVLTSLAFLTAITSTLFPSLVCICRFCTADTPISG